MKIEFSSTTENPVHLPLLALDIGKRRIGVAVCDKWGLSARGVTTLSRKDAEWPQKVERICREYGCRGVIVGLAKNMDGTEGAQATDCRRAAGALAAVLNVPVLLWDERLSTWSAKERLRSLGLNERKVASLVDQTAAAIILEDFIAANRTSLRA